MPALTASVIHFDGSAQRRAPKDGALVVVDVLRATTAIACALAHGARAVIPVRHASAARRVARSIDGALLGGEEKNSKIPGFDFGNSPSEYDDRVRTKTIVMRTTNGTRVLEALSGRKPVFCAAFANVSAVARALGKRDVAAVTFICAGQDGAFSLEDFACAGAILDKCGGSREIDCDDEAIAARELFRANKEKASGADRNGRSRSCSEGCGIRRGRCLLARARSPGRRSGPRGESARTLYFVAEQ